MRILDNDTGSSISNMTLYFTRAEAEEVAQSIRRLIVTPAEHHVHINDAGYEREITITIYSEADLTEFDERSRQLIKEGI
jgi:hypothetical protein